MSTGGAGLSRQGSPGSCSRCSWPAGCSRSAATGAATARRKRRRSRRACRAADARSCRTSAWSPTTARRRTTSWASSASARRGSPLRRLERQAKPYARPRRPVLPAMELIAAIVTSEAGDGGDHSMRQDDSTIRRYLRVGARAPDAAPARHPAGLRALPPGGEGARALAEGAGRRARARSRVEHEAAAPARRRRSARPTPRR